MSTQTNSNLDYSVNSWTDWENCDWQAELRSNITTIDALEGYLQLTDNGGWLDDLPEASL